MEIKKEIYLGVYEITRPDGSKIITGEGWATHIHEGVDWFNIKIERPANHSKVSRTSIVWWINTYRIG